MKCYLCNKKASIKQQKNRYICNKCFSWLFEKRIRKQTRLDQSFKPRDRILAIGQIANYLTKSITKNMNVKIFQKNKIDSNFIKKNKINKIVIEYTLDDELNQYIKGIFEKKKEAKKDKKYIKILKNVTDNDVLLFAKINKLKFKPNKKDKNIQEFLNSIQAKFPNAKYTLLKNINKLRKLQ
jgi:hypothetical protein